MRRLALPLLLLAVLPLAFAPAPLPRRARTPDPGVVELARLTPAEADRLDGQLLRYRVVLDEASPGPQRRRTLRCRHEHADVGAAVRMPCGGGERPGDVLLVWGRVSVLEGRRTVILVIEAEGS